MYMHGEHTHTERVASYFEVCNCSFPLGNHEQKMNKKRMKKVHSLRAYRSSTAQTHPQEFIYTFQTHVISTMVLILHFTQTTFILTVVRLYNRDTCSWMTGNTSMFLHGTTAWSWMYENHIYTLSNKCVLYNIMPLTALVFVTAVTQSGHHDGCFTPETSFRGVSFSRLEILTMW